MRYISEHISQRGGFISDAYDKFQPVLQDALDKGAKKGWELVSSHIFNGVSKGLEAYLIWKVPN